MATAVQVSVSDYLNTTYRPDLELLDGRLIERNVGEYDHSNLQGALVAWMRTRQREWNIRVLPEQRIQVAPCSRPVCCFPKAKTGSGFYRTARDLRRNTLQTGHAAESAGSYRRLPVLWRSEHLDTEPGPSQTPSLCLHPWRFSRTRRRSLRSSRLAHPHSY